MLRTFKACSSRTICQLPKFGYKLSGLCGHSLVDSAANSERHRMPVFALKSKNFDSTNKAKVLVQGWVKTCRKLKHYTFLHVNDGSSVDSIQVVLPSDSSNLPNLSTGCSVSVYGVPHFNPSDQSIELVEAEVKVLGECDSSFPLQKKKHSFEFLREICHLRSRTNTIGAILRIRNAATVGLNTFLQNNGFIQVHTPILSPNDCEGAGEVFLVNTRADLENTKNQYNTFFNIPECYLTVSGQLEAEAFASSHSKVYSFGPTFRAENSHTTRHLSEFWMLEPEMAFVDLTQVIETIEALVKFGVEFVNTKCEKDMSFLREHVDNVLLERLAKDQSRPYNRMTYSEAIKVLQEQSPYSDTRWGVDLGTEQERWLCEVYSKRPLFVTHYPRSIKPFYARLSDTLHGDSEVVECCDLLVGGVGELVGGSVREERLDVLVNLFSNKTVSSSLQWYLDLRRYGSVPHGGFGLGFERFMLYLTGMENINDVIPIPRRSGHCKF